MVADNKSMLGRTVALVGCPAYRDGDNEAILITGLYHVAEFVPREPAAYVQSAGWYVAPEGSTGDMCDVGLFVDDYDLWAQVAPGEFGRFIAEDRWLSQWLEDNDPND